MINNYIDLPTSDATVPSGSATAANQVLEIAQLVAINFKLTPPLAVIGPLTNIELRASPVPVSGTVAVTGPLSVTQGTVPWIVDGSGFTQPISALSLPLPAGASTSALQLVGNASLSSIDSKIIIADTDNVTVIASALPAGAATSANQATEIASLVSIDAGIPAALGQTTMANSMPVVLASNQSPITVVGSVTTSPDVNVHDGTGVSISSTGSSLNVNVTNTVPVTGVFFQATQPVSGTLTANIGTTNGLALDTTVSGLLTNTQLRAAPVPVSLTSTTITGTVAVTQSTSPWVVSGTVTSNIGTTGGLALDTTVSGLLTNTQLRATPVPISGTVSVSNFPAYDTNYGTVGANTLRTAAQIGNATGAADFNAGVTGAQTLRVVSNLNDGSANAITSQANGAQRALDVGINVAGVQIDPRAASPGTLTNRSGTATTTSAVLAPANAARKYLFIQNLDINNIWINFTAAATTTSGSIRIASGGVFTMEGSFISTEVVNIRSETLTRIFTAKEG